MDYTLRALEKCICCGQDVAVKADATSVECRYCHTRMSVSRFTQEEKKLATQISQMQMGLEQTNALIEEFRASQAGEFQNLYHQAEDAQRGRRFEEAIEKYKELAIKCPDEAEIYWRIMLCTYGIEYVRDQAGGEALPTFTRMNVDDILRDENYLKARQCAPDADMRRFYTEEGRKLNGILGDYQRINGEEAPYDVFISVKQGDEAGKITNDAYEAGRLYNLLVNKGYRVFNSRESLKPGDEYEPYIMHALSTAKVLVVVSSSQNYLDAPWVRNEWRRFNWLRRNDASVPRKLITYILGTAEMNLHELGVIQYICTATHPSPQVTLCEAVEAACGKKTKQKKTADLEDMTGYLTDAYNGEAARYVCKQGVDMLKKQMDGLTEKDSPTEPTRLMIEAEMESPGRTPEKSDIAKKYAHPGAKPRKKDIEQQYPNPQKIPDKNALYEKRKREHVVVEKPNLPHINGWLAFLLWIAFFAMFGWLMGKAFEAMGEWMNYYASDVQTVLIYCGMMVYFVFMCIWPGQLVHRINRLKYRSMYRRSYKQDLRTYKTQWAKLQYEVDEEYNKAVKDYYAQVKQREVDIEKAYNDALKNYEKRLQDHNSLERVYAREVAEHQEKVKAYNAAVDERYKRAMEEYHRQTKDYQKYCAVTAAKRVSLQRLIAAYGEVEKGIAARLSALYAKDMLHHNFRNFTAVNQLREYLTMGICDEMEGKSGAYARYFDDVRAGEIQDTPEKLRASGSHSVTQNGLVDFMTEVGNEVDDLRNELSERLDEIQGKEDALTRVPQLLSGQCFERGLCQQRIESAVVVEAEHIRRLAGLVQQMNG